MRQWVQHKSGVGEKWEVMDDHGDAWEHTRPIKGQYGRRVFYLPKSEYTICEPPYEWQDVTSEFHATNTWPSEKHSKSNGIANNEDEMLWIPADLHHTGDLRLRKIDGLHNGPCFIVERRKP